MELELLDAKLRRIANEPGHSPKGWGDGEARHFLLIAQCAQAAKTENDLLALRMLRLQAHPDELSKSWVQLSAQRRLTITFNDENRPIIAQFDLAVTRMEVPK